MQDFCFHAPTESAILAALESLGLTKPDLDGRLRPIGEYAYAGRVTDQPGEYAIGSDGAMAVVHATTYLPGVYAKYRATDEQATAIEAAPLLAGVEIVESPQHLPLFGGVWLGGPTLIDLKAAACERISTECARRRAAGVAVTFPDGTGVVQTRNDVDLVNAIGVSAAGLAATVAGTLPELYFRDEANTNHALLPTQAVDFGAQVMQHLQAITKAAHDAKDAINADAVTTAAQIAAIETGVVWPE